MPVVNVNQRTVEGPNFTSFVITKKDEADGDEKAFSLASLRSLKQLAVPDDVNVEQVVQFLRDKRVNVFEGSSSAETSEHSGHVSN